MEKMKHFDTIVVLLIDISINKGIKEKTYRLAHNTIQG